MKPCVLASKNWWKIRREFSSKNPSHILELKGEFRPTIKETESPLELTLAAGGAQAIFAKLLSPFNEKNFAVVLERS
jgi:hypothetical protein